MLGMPQPGSWFDRRVSIADEQYVSFTTFRRSGEPVATPVWIAPLEDGRAGFTTGATSGKAKRLAHTSRVLLQPCNQRGVTLEGTVEVEATARLVGEKDTEFGTVRAAIKAKYGMAFTLIATAGKLNQAIRRSKGKTPNGAVVIDLSA